MIDDVDLKVVHEALELGRESDRGCILVAAALVDTRLERALRAKLLDDPAVARKLLDKDRPLATFSARANLAYLLGLVCRAELTAIDAIRAIRNRAAHADVPISFGEFRTDPELRKPWHALAGFMRSPPTDPRDDFLRALALVLLGLDHSCPFVERVKEVTLHLPKQSQLDRDFILRMAPIILRKGRDENPGVAPTTADVLDIVALHRVTWAAEDRAAKKDEEED